MKSNVLRIITALFVVALITFGFVTDFGVGTLSALGWSTFSILCPLGALGTMLASKMMVPSAVISLIFAVLFIVVFGRAFCAWICPVPLVKKLRSLFAKRPSRQLNDVQSEAPSVAASVSAHAACSGTSCSSCAEKRGRAFDARHAILGGSLLSAALFGFPVFCLVCPIGLSFATILLVVRLFSGGDVTWSLIVVPFILIAEVVLFKKWCGKLCPLSAFMSLVGKLNRTFKPSINEASCIESSRERDCGICANVCPEGIDPRHPERGSAWSECTKCRACVDACPTKAITMPFLSRLQRKTSHTEVSDGQAE